METKQTLIILISHENYLRNWIQAGSFDRLCERYNVRYVVVKDYWDPNDITRFGVRDYDVVAQPSYRKFLLRRVLTVTMFKYVKRSRAFEVKLLFVKPGWRWFYKLLALPGIYELFLATVRAVLPKWPEFSQLVERHGAVAVVAPSIGGDSFTIDMTYTAEKMGVKSALLINSWDNLVSKGVLPMPPDRIVVWGEQGIGQAITIQGVPAERIVALGLPRFEAYFGAADPAAARFIYDFNRIPAGKKIVLYATSALPFDDMTALAILDGELSSNPALADYVILFRPHPEMMKRVAERNFAECGFRNVYLDQQVAGYYRSRFEATTDDYPSFINNAELEYYPALLKAIVGIVCPPTTLALEGALNGKPSMMICYGDGKNNKLSPDQVSRYGFIEDLLAMPGMVSCYREADLRKGFRALIAASSNPQTCAELVEATRFIVYRDAVPYADRLCNAVDSMVAGTLAAGTA